jgi:hypothetical protein
MGEDSTGGCSDEKEGPVSFITIEDLRSANLCSYPHERFMRWLFVLSRTGESDIGGKQNGHRLFYSNGARVESQ